MSKLLATLALVYFSVSAIADAEFLSVSEEHSVIRYYHDKYYLSAQSNDEKELTLLQLHPDISKKFMSLCDKKCPTAYAIDANGIKTVVLEVMTAPNQLGLLEFYIFTEKGTFIASGKMSEAGGFTWNP